MDYKLKTQGAHEHAMRTYMQDVHKRTRRHKTQLNKTPYPYSVNSEMLIFQTHPNTCEPFLAIAIRHFNLTGVKRT